MANTIRSRNGAQCTFPTGSEGDPGLTKREYFAGLAMQGIVSNADYYLRNGETFALCAVALADELLTELDKE